jgi:hypothetical protein
MIGAGPWCFACPVGGRRAFSPGAERCLIWPENTRAMRASEIAGPGLMDCVQGAPTLPGTGRRRRALLGGGTDGNDQLTANRGRTDRPARGDWRHDPANPSADLRAPVRVPAAVRTGGVEGGRHRPPVCAVLRPRRAVTGQGPAGELFMRVIAPVVVISTVAVFASGIVPLFEGPVRRGDWVGIHKASLSGVADLHRVARPPAPGAPPGFAARRPRRRCRIGGGAGRWIVLAAALIGDVVHALVLVPRYAPWTAHGAFLHHH